MFLEVQYMEMRLHGIWAYGAEEEHHGKSRHPHLHNKAQLTAHSKQRDHQDQDWLAEVGLGSRHLWMQVCSCSAT